MKLTGKSVRAAIAGAFLAGCELITVEPWDIDRNEIPAGLDQFAVSFLATQQAKSFANRAEYCGFFYLTPNGFAATPANRGGKASCRFGTPPLSTVANWHTHGAYDEGYDNEVPSPTDLQSNFLINRDGYVSTPGGRVWLVDAADRETRQLCGRGCVPADPRWVDEDDAAIRPSYTLEGLDRRRRER